jgi:serine/threonine protein phosphatase 1
LYEYFTQQYIEKLSSGRRFAIGDIHGCYKTFKYLLEYRLKITNEDQIFLLGDYIARGPKSRKTLNYIIKLIKNGYKIYPLRGNNEQMLLYMTHQQIEILLWHLKGIRSLDLLKNGKISNKHLNFLDQLPYYYELDNYYLVHAGFDFSKPNPFKIRNSMLLIRTYKPTEEQINKKKIIHGHSPTYIDKIINKVDKKNNIISLDNGIYIRKFNKIYDYNKLGNLCGLDLDSSELFIQENLDIPLQIK